MSSAKQSLSGIEDLLFAVKDYVPTGLFELNDTPTGYLGHSGDYLVVNDGETGIHFTGIEKIASDLTDYGFLDGVGGVGGGGGSSTGGAFESLPLRDTHPSTDSIPFAIPDAIIAKNNVGNEMILSLEVITENSTDLANNRNLIYTAYTADYSIYFQNDTNGSFKQSNNIQGAYQQNLKWFVDNDHALYYGGGAGGSGGNYEFCKASFASNQSPVGNVATSPINLDSSALTQESKDWTFLSPTYNKIGIKIPTDGLYNIVGEALVDLSNSTTQSDWQSNVVNHGYEVRDENGNLVAFSHNNKELNNGDDLKADIYTANVYLTAGTILTARTSHYRSGGAGSYVYNNTVSYLNVEKAGAAGGSSSATTTFDALTDTPVDYVNHSGKYLVVTDGEDGVHFTGVEKIASDLTDYGFGGGGVLDIPKYTFLPDATDNDNKIVAFGCDLYHSCNGQWQKILKEGDNVALPANSSYPGCVSTISESILYDEYKDQFIEDITEDVFERELLGLQPLPTHEVCLYTADPRNVIKIEETDAKWGLFYGDQTVNITGAPHSSDVNFLKWESSAPNVLGDENSDSTTLLVNGNMDVIAYFQGSISTDTVNLDPAIEGLEDMTYSNGILALSSSQQGVRLFSLLEDGTTDLIFSNDQGQNYGNAIALHESGNKLAVADYAQAYQRVYLYEKQSDNTFLFKNSIANSRWSFGTDLKWIGDKIYVSTYQWYEIYEYDVASDYSATQVRVLYHNPDNITRPTSGASWGYNFGIKFDVYSNNFIVAKSRENHIHFAYLENDEWVVNVNEGVEIAQAMDSNLDSNTLTIPQNTILTLAIKDRNTVYVGIPYCTVNGLTQAGALWRLSKLGNQWLHTQTMVSDNPISNGTFGRDIEFRGGQLFALETASGNPNKIKIFNIS